MGAGTIIATAIAITLMIITGYVLIGGTLSTARVVALGQQAAADREAEKLNTRIEIFSATTVNTEVPPHTYIIVNNTGSTVIRDFNHTEVYLLQGTNTSIFTTVRGNVTISPDAIHPGLLDPDEAANITVAYDQSLGDPAWVKVTTANGVYASKYTVVL
jgi:archaeal flagellar protein FlaF